ncbi:MAG: hypothetical protein IJC18_00130, partial [Clostridia bacterium]|nr:hypothetical protein [Clostridia bacterium]
MKLIDTNSKGVRLFLWAAVLILCLCSSVLISSGGLLSTRRNTGDYRNAAEDIRTGTSAFLGNIVNESLGLPKVYPLPMSESGGSKPDESGYSSYV